MTYFWKEKQEKGEEREGGMTYPRINDGTKLYKPPLERVRESAVVSLLSPTTQTPDAVPSQKLLSLVCTSDLVRPILWTCRNIDNYDELTQPVLGPGDGPPSSWGRGGSGDQAHPPRRRDQPDDFGPASLPASRCGNDSLKMWKWCRRNDAEAAEEMMQKQGEEKKCQ